MKIDTRSHVPIYRQIADGIRRQIAAGVFRAGEGLPSIRALALELRVNHNTVQRAYEVLEHGRLIRSGRGVGMFVTTRGSKVAKQRTVTEATAALRVAIRRCVEAEIEGAEIRAVIAAEVEAAPAARPARKPASQGAR